MVYMQETGFADGPGVKKMLWSEQVSHALVSATLVEFAS